MLKYITQAEYARKYGITQSAVSQAVKAGRLHRRTKDGKVDGSVDIRSIRAVPSAKEAEDLRHEKLRLQNELLRTRIAEEREKIAAAAVRAEFAPLAEIIDDLRSDLSAIGLTVEQSTQFKEALNRAYARIIARTSVSSAAH